MHVMEKLWKAAYVFHAEGSLDADLWVMDRSLRILSGDVGQVVKGLRQSITKRGLSGARRKTLEAVANYLYRNRTRMRYDVYLANGWPIASGPVEGACKNLIKDRMERSGMRARPNRWLKPSFSSEPSPSPETSIPTGTSTSSRISDAYIPPYGASFQSSHTRLILTKIFETPAAQPSFDVLSDSPEQSEVA